MGKISNYAAGAMAALAMVFSAQTATAEDDCRLTPLASFAISPDFRDVIAIPVKINDRELLLSLSTASPRSGIDDSVATELGLLRAATGFEGIHGDMRAPGLWMGRDYITLRGKTLDEMAYASSLDLGGMTGKNVRFTIFPDNGTPRKIAGALGTDILRQYDVELDFAAGKVNLFSHRHCPGKVIYWTRQPYASARFHLDQGFHIEIPVEVDGESLTAVVATGITHPLMKLDTARRVFGWHSDPAALKPDPDHKGDYDYPFKALRFAGATVHDPIVKLTDEDLHEKPDMLLGLSALKAFHVYISYDEQTIYLTARDAH